VFVSHVIGHVRQIDVPQKRTDLVELAYEHRFVSVSRLSSPNALHHVNPSLVSHP
jgi:hypothetical protein